MKNLYDSDSILYDYVGYVNYDRIIKGVAHRGFSSIAPENTLPAYRLAKELGFYYVETDISFTSDNVPVCLHDSTINRTSNGSGSISSMTYDQVRQYDFGSWKNACYEGTKIPSFEEFIRFCRNVGLHPYIEIKNNETYSQAQIESLIDTVKAFGMKGKVSWISFSLSYLNYVKNYDNEARLGYVTSSVSESIINSTNGLKTGNNDVFLDTSSMAGASVTLCKNANIPMEVWTIDSENSIINANPYITGFTSNTILAGRLLYNTGMSEV